MNELNTSYKRTVPSKINTGVKTVKKTISGAGIEQRQLLYFCVVCKEQITIIRSKAFVGTV